MQHTTTALAYYAQIGAALFPIPAGQKNPTGIVGSFAQDCSADAAQWQKWSTDNPGCNWGVVAGPSKLIIVDIDIKEGRDAAWSAYVELCKLWDMPAHLPQVESASGGWHVYFSVPEGVDAKTLRQPDAIKKVINVRAGNGYTVTAGSTFEGRPYTLTNTAPPYPAPQALVDHCTRKAAPATSAVVGSRDAGDVALLLDWMNEHDAFAAYEDWVGAGMALKLEFGDAGLALWQHCHNDTVTSDVEATKWQSFATEPTAGCQTLNTLLANAHKLGWTGNVRRSLGDMFAGVAGIAQAAGAQLPQHQKLPMVAFQENLTNKKKPDLETFLKNTSDQPIRPHAKHYPRLPESMNWHGLYPLLCSAIDRIIAMAEPDGQWNAGRCNDVLATLKQVHEDTYNAVCLHVQTLGRSLNISTIKGLSAGMAEEILNEVKSPDEYVRSGQRNEIDTTNSDNVRTFLRHIDCSVRFNRWRRREEIQGNLKDALGAVRWPDWTPIDDTVINHLIARATQFGTDYKVQETYLRRVLNSTAHDNPHDEVVEHIAKRRDDWDGEYRLSSWLHVVCGVPCDPYHQAVSRHVIGGMVRRAMCTSPNGVKHDEMAVFFGIEGTDKSTMARVLALKDEWYISGVKLGENKKELIPMLRGKLIAEIAEMDSRGTVETIKDMLSAQVDSAREVYQRENTDSPRRCIFIGNSNHTEFLHSDTGNRRFLPVQCERKLDIAWLRANIDQLVGEAAVALANGDDFQIPRDVYALQAEHTDAARVRSEAEIALESHLAENPNVPSSYILSSDLDRLVEGSTRYKSNTARGATMKRLGFTKARVNFPDRLRVSIWLRDNTGMLHADIPRLAAQIIVQRDANNFVRVVTRLPYSAPPAPQR